jgi:hypothetical protein
MPGWIKRTYQGYEIDLVLESVRSAEYWAFQITMTGKQPFSKAFQTYQPAKTFLVTRLNAYQFCW